MSSLRRRMLKGAILLDCQVDSEILRKVAFYDLALFIGVDGLLH